jgi:RHS repeat-associated protein
MPKPATFTPTEISALASWLREVWRPGSQITPWLRDNAERLTKLNREERFSWAAAANDTNDTVSYNYDAANRVTKITYPDGTTDTYTYNNLDLASYTDRLGRIWTYTYDADRRMTARTDPTGHQTQYGYNPDGSLTSLTDPNGNVTQWAYDLEDRLITKTYADSSTVTYTYENTTSRLKSVLDALGQTKQYAYDEANELTGITYLSAINSTPNVTFAYDPYFPRRVSMTDGTGTTQYSYVPAGSLGALQLQQQVPPLAGSTIAYAYDALGRLSSRTVEGAGAETFGYDALGRLTSDTNDLGAFTLAYLGQTKQITSRQLASSSLATAWSYLPNSGDRRLSEVSTTGLSSGQYSTFQYTTNAEDQITGTTQTSDVTPLYPSAGQQTAGFNNLNQITTLENPPPSSQAYTYDADGNLLSDGTRDYSWDAENRLVGITYPGHSGQAAAFAYDGLGRRVTITDTPAGGSSPVATSYVWCGARPCQARNSSNVVTREYYAEGEDVPGASATPYYYGIDNLGSVRRVFYAGGAPTYDYDPYGNPLQITAPVTDFGYAGMFLHQPSGLYLTEFRAYDPVTGRWLSRDPAGEIGGINLYAYVKGDPVSFTDPLGLGAWPWGALPGWPMSTPYPPSNIPGGPWIPAQGQRPGAYYGPKQPSGGRPMCQYVPPEDQGGPPGSQGYWKTGNQQGWGQRYNQQGEPITPDEAHPGPSGSAPPEPVAPAPEPEISIPPRYRLNFSYVFREWRGG